MIPLAPGVSIGQFHGISAWLVETPHARAAISPQGGQLLSFTPAGFDDLLWLSPLTATAPKAIRGGVPVCWPYFGRQGQPADVPQHGHARLDTWRLIRTTTQDDGGIRLELELPPRDPSPLRLQQVIVIGQSLRQSLITTNSGQQSVRHTQALHSYFDVGDVAQVRITGVDGLYYADNYDKARHLQVGDWSLDDPRDPGRSDRIHANAGNHFELIDPAAGRRIAIHTEGSRSLVVWNPGAAGAQALADVPDAAWDRFVCIEAANAGEDVVELDPGQSHTLGQCLSVHRMGR